ncbi:MAG: hypothetical protein D6731_05450 [Planctomycetota bacterium]|nr:MAG: hypothetical protein D6731_05450 [Planctomycetota bacterium]
MTPLPSTRRALRVLLALLLLCALGTARAQEPESDRSSRGPLPTAVPPLPRGERALRFIVLGDYGTGLPGQRRVAARMAERARAGLDFIVTTGDNFYPFGVRSADDPLWERVWRRVYAAPALAVPWYPSLGNHDHVLGFRAQLAYSRKDPRWRLPARYHRWALPLGGGRSVEFFVLDTTLLRRGLDPDQLAWLERVLAASKATWKIAIGHHPLYSYSKRPHDASLIRLVEPLFVRNRVDVYFAGHDHVLELLKARRGVHYVVSGAGGGPDNAYGVRWTDDCHYAVSGGGFVLARLSASMLVLEFVRMDGRTEYAHVIPKGRAGPF